MTLGEIMSPALGFIFFECPTLKKLVFMSSMLEKVIFLIFFSNCSSLYVNRKFKSNNIKPPQKDVG
jgi:hypothetical protein